MAPACAERSHSQWADDIRLLPMLACAAGAAKAGFAAPLPLAVPAGSFVELGAFDGVVNSNTIMLERCYGWRGLLIEASPTNFAKLDKLSNRSATKVHSAVCKGATGDDAAGGFVEFSAAGDQFGGELELLPNATLHSHRLARFNLRSNTTRVPCAPLRTLMARAAVPEVDFLSLDVEGAEVKVWRGQLPAPSHR